MEDKNAQAVLTVLAHKSDKSSIITPNRVLDRQAVELGNGLLLLNVI